MSDPRWQDNPQQQGIHQQGIRGQQAGPYAQNGYPPQNPQGQNLQAQNLQGQDRFAQQPHQGQGARPGQPPSSLDNSYRPLSADQDRYQVTTVRRGGRFRPFLIVLAVLVGLQVIVSVMYWIVMVVNGTR